MRIFRSLHPSGSRCNVASKAHESHIASPVSVITTLDVECILGGRYIDNVDVSLAVDEMRSFYCHFEAS